MSDDLARLCKSHGIEPTYEGSDGRTRRVPDDTLAALAEVFGLDAPGTPPPGIDEARAESDPPRCYIPAWLAGSRVWGLTCQLSSLVSDRNLGMGDFADLATLARIAAAEGADFLGVNPLHALFWSDPSRHSPFSPSNRRFVNPLYLAPEWITGFEGLAAAEAREATRLRAAPLLDLPAIARLKDRVLRRLYGLFPADDGERAAFDAFRAGAGEALARHALFEALSEFLSGEGFGAGCAEWPACWRDLHSAEVRAFADRHRERVDYHLWLQWQTDRQLACVHNEAQEAGMRIGLYLDFAVGAAPDGSAAWSDPALTVPGVSIGAPPDDFSAQGQDWGLAPLSPVRLAALDARPLADLLSAALRHAGAVRIDHVMGVARLWLIARHAPARDGAYVRYPLPMLLKRVAEASNQAGALVIGEDLGVVPAGFRALMAERRLQGYRVFLFEHKAGGLADPADWDRDALACFATHDMPTFAGWWAGADLDLRRDLGMLATKEWIALRTQRTAERDMLQRRLDGPSDSAALSPLLHAHIAASPCRLVALQLEDALGVMEQVNLPGTVDEYPNWRRRLPVPLDRLADHPGFRAHAAALRQARPR